MRPRLRSDLLAPVLCSMACSPPEFIGLGEVGQENEGGRGTVIVPVNPGGGSEADAATNTESTADPDGGTEPPSSPRDASAEAGAPEALGADGGVTPAVSPPGDAAALTSLDASAPSADGDAGPPGVEVLDAGGLDANVVDAGDADTGKLPQFAFWLDSDLGRVQRTDLVRGGAETLVDGLGPLRSIALDVLGGKLYWTTAATGEDGGSQLQRASLDGSDVESLSAFGGEVRLAGLALDPARGHLYFVDQGDAPSIRRANLDGTDVQELIPAGSDLGAPYGIAVDGDNERAYWVDGELHTLERADLAGEDRVVLAEGLDAPLELALDASAGKLWWTDAGPESDPGVYRCNLDGSAVERVVSNLVAPIGLALDVANQDVYWTDGGAGGAGSLQRSNFEGEELRDLLADLNAPRGVALW